METISKSEVGQVVTSKNNWPKITLITVALILGLVFVGDRLFFKVERDIHSDIINQTASAYLELSEQSKPQLIGVYSEEEATIELREMTKQDTALVVMELTEGPSAGFRFQQEVDVVHPEPNSTELKVRISPMLMLYKKEGEVTKRRLYFTQSNKTVELDRYFAKVTAFKPDFSSLKSIFTEAEVTWQEMRDSLEGLKGSAWPKTLPE